jgi:hypothetical protein
LIPAPGDAHHHSDLAGAVRSLVEFGVCGEQGLPDTQFGFPQDIYASAATKGFLWVNALQHHESLSNTETSSVYEWWTGSSLQDLIDRDTGNTFIDFPRHGFPDWAQPQNLCPAVQSCPVNVDPPWRETRSLLSARDLAPPGFAGFAGIEKDLEFLADARELLAIHGELTPSTDCEGCDDFAFAHWLKAHGVVNARKLTPFQHLNIDPPFIQDLGAAVGVLIHPSGFNVPRARRSPETRRSRALTAGPRGGGRARERAVLPRVWSRVASRSFILGHPGRPFFAASARSSPIRPDLDP